MYAEVLSEAAVRADDLLQTRSVRCGNTVVLRLAGELDMFTAPLVDRAVIDALAGGPGSVRLDLTGLVFCDGAGLRALRRLTDTVKAHRVVLTLVGMHPNMRRTLTRLPADCTWHPPPSSRSARP